MEHKLIAHIMFEASSSISFDNDGEFVMELFDKVLDIKKEKAIIRLMQFSGPRMAVVLFRTWVAGIRSKFWGPEKNRTQRQDFESTYNKKKVHVSYFFF